MIPVERVVVEIGQHALCVVDEVDVSLGCALFCAVFGGGFFILRNFDVGQPVFGRDFGMFRFCRFLARTGTLLGDGDGGRFCAAENGDDGFSGSWLDIFRKRGGNGVFTGIAEGRRKGDPSVAATGGLYRGLPLSGSFETYRVFQSAVGRDRCG